MRRRKPPLVKVPIILFILAMCAIAAAGLYAKPVPSDLAVVLGSDAEKGVPGPRLQARLDTAIHLYNHQFMSRIMVSGGIEADGSDEATIMAAYLVDHGIPKSAIITDSGGRNTMATAVHVKAAMRENDLLNVIIVTQYFHIPRCYVAFRRAGIKDISAAYPDYYDWRDGYSLPREAVALPWYFIRNVGD